jgi:outer membrane lipoprotein SlyB
MCPDLSTGHIISIKGASNGGNKSEIALAFNSITLGELSGKFDAQVVEVFDVDAGHQATGQSKGKTVVKRATPSTAIGAAIGAAIGGGQGAAAGAAIGAASGASSTLVMDEPLVDLKAGTQLRVKTVGGFVRVQEDGYADKMKKPNTDRVKSGSTQSQQLPNSVIRYPTMP